jgi:hypothetical protein
VIFFPDSLAGRSIFEAAASGRDVAACAALYGVPCEPVYGFCDDDRRPVGAYFFPFCALSLEVWPCPENEPFWLWCR